MGQIEPGKVWITGCGGLIGHALLTCPSRPTRWQPRGLTRSDLDLEDFAAVTQLFQKEQPAAIVHCAALSRTPACEQAPELARQINVAVTRHLVGLARDIPLIFLSTDLVFDGQQGGYDEAAPVCPQTVYAETKVEAEELVLAQPRHLVVRTSLNHGRSPTGDRAFNEQLIATWQRGQSASLFVDEFRQPIPASVTADILWRLLDRGSRGLFHVAGRERLSRWEIGCLLAAQHPEVRPQLAPGSCRDLPGLRRSPNTTLQVKKVEAELGIRMPNYSAWLFADRLAERSS
jgi:dTDP-4-dehydrorhamnose reductase